MIPPLITVGSSCAVSSSAPIIEVVVVLPCVPAIASDHLSRISSPSISARRTTGMRRALAAMTSELSGLTAEEITTTSAAPRFSAFVSDGHRNPEIDEPTNIGAVGQVTALYLIAEIVQYLGDAAHPDPADADEMDAVRSSAAGLSCRPPVRPGRHDRARRRAARGRAPRRAGRIRRRAEQRSVNAAWSPSRFSRWRAKVSGRSSDCAMTHPAPASAKARAFAAWWSSVACGYGISIAGRPTTASSAKVEAPARHIARCARANRSGTSAKKLCSSAWMRLFR